MRKEIKKISLCFCISLFVLFLAVGVQAIESIVLRVLVANPSREQPQIVPVKIYLPKETKPEDIIDKEDLEVGYDTQQGSYYVYGEYELVPLATLEKNIELRDIWLISGAELVSLREEAEKINDLLKDTEFAERVRFLGHSITAKLSEIEERQKVVKPNPEDHISEYRYNLKLMESAKTDLAMARSMLDKARAFSPLISWKLIIFILIFLGVLAVSFYFLWYKQASLFEEPQAPGEEDREKGELPRDHKADEAKKADTEDRNIEKIIREDK